jgi:hypothetical protein
MPAEEFLTELAALLRCQAKPEVVIEAVASTRPGPPEAGCLIAVIVVEGCLCFKYPKSERRIRDLPGHHAAPDKRDHSYW